MKHIFDIGQLVELYNGSRLFVFAHSRGSDGTPLYTLAHVKEGASRYNLVYGYSEAQLKHCSILKRFIRRIQLKYGLCLTRRKINDV